MVFLLQYEPRVVRARRETRGPRATASGSVAENMAESAATPLDLDDTLPEGVYQIDPLFEVSVDGDLNGVKHWLQGFSVDCSNLLADCGSSGCTPLPNCQHLIASGGEHLGSNAGPVGKGNFQ